MSSSLLAVGSGPEVGLVDGVALQRPAAFVGQEVVEDAEPGGVVEAAGSAVAAPDDVVEVDDGGAAVGERASSAVAGVGGAAGGDVELSAGLADFDDLAIGAEHDRDDLRVTGEPACGGGGDGRAVGEAQPPLLQLVFQCCQVDGDDDGAWGAGERRRTAVTEVSRGDHPERVMRPL